LNRYEKQSSRKKKDKAVSFPENGSEKNSRAVRSRARLNQTQNWSWLSRIYKPNKQNVFNSAFLSLKIIVDTLIDVGNAKHQNITP